LQGLKEGFRYVTSSTPIRSLLLIVAAMSLCVAPFVILLPYYAKEVFHGDARLLGLLTGCSGIGALSGALFLASRKHVAILGRYVLFASCIGALALMPVSKAGRYGGFCQVVCSGLVSSSLRLRVTP
jgi:hypothetical protein